MTVTLTQSRGVSGPKEKAGLADTPAGRKPKSSESHWNTHKCSSADLTEASQISLPRPEKEPVTYKHRSSQNAINTAFNSAHSGQTFWR